MKAGLLFLFGAVIGTTALAQNMDVLQPDMLRRALTEAKHDSTRALVMTQLAESYRDRLTDTSYFYASQALEMSRRIDYKTGESKALLALSYHFFNRGDLTKALELGLEALGIAQKNNLRYDQAFAMIRIGNVYMSLKEYREALRYFHQTRQLTKNSPDSFFYAVTFWRAAHAYSNLNMPDSALFFAKIAEDTARGMGNNFILHGISPLLGSAYARMGNDSLALQYLRKSNVYFASLPLAYFFNKRKMYDSALYYAKIAYGASLRNRIKQAEMESAALLSSLYESTDPKQALDFLKIAVQAKDSLHGAEKISAAQSVSFKEKERQKEMLIAEIAYRNKVRLIAILSGLALVTLTALLLFRSNRKEKKANALLHSQKNEIAKALTDLRNTQTQLVQKEKMASLGELTAGIAHEIQNPLNFVNNFSELNTELAGELEEAATKGAFDEVRSLASDIRLNQEKIKAHGQRADAIVKSMLQHSRAGSGKQEITDINKLVDEYVRLSHQGYRSKQQDFNAKLNINLDPAAGIIPIVSQDIGQVLINLLNNSFYAVHSKALMEYADELTNGATGATSANGELAETAATKHDVQTGRALYEPTVNVRTFRKGKQVFIEVSDNGAGIPERIRDKIFQPFFSTKPTGQGTGLGLSLSYDIVKAHRGDIRVNSTEGQGSEFVIELPVSS